MNPPRVIGFRYDGNGNRTGVERPNGIDSTYAYDLADRLTSIVHADGLGTVQSFAYTLDAVGNRTSVTHGGGTESYTVDDLNRITAVDYPTGDDATYQYDANGNITEMTVGQATTTFTHDDADQLTSDGTDSYYYDDNGNMTDAGSDDFTWDYRNMMTSSTVDTVTTDYEYDGDGVRVAKDTTDYLYDRESGLPMLVDDETNAYLHDDGVLATIDGSDEAQYLLDDALGSVRGVTDEAGDLDGAADYNVYGEVRASSGVSTLFRFTGEQHDPETGFTYLRARYANPALGRFVSADSVQPNAPGTQGYNPYAYVGNNPTTWVDPSGHSVAELQALAANVFEYGIIAVALVGCPTIGLGLCASVGIAVLVCALTPGCLSAAMDLAKYIHEFGSSHQEPGDSVCWLFDPLCDLASIPFSPPFCTDQVGVSGGGGYPDNVSCELAAFCANPGHWYDCRVAEESRQDAYDATEEEFGCFIGDPNPPPECEQITKSDYFRHCLGAGLMTQELGAKTAESLLNKYENFQGNPANEREFDQNSNAEGIRFAMSTKDVQALRQACLRGAEKHPRTPPS